MSELTKIQEMVNAALGAWTVSEEEAMDWEASRQKDRRRDALSALDGAITDEDVERIVANRLDTFASEVVRRFLAAANEPPKPGKAPVRFCWLAGPRGTGKTVAACMAIAAERGRYMTAEEMRRAFCQETDEAKQLRNYAIHCRLLVVDDLGTEKNAADAAQSKAALYQLVNARQGKRRLTILTGNLSDAAIRKTHDARTVERIEHQGRIVAISGDNLRRSGYATARGVNNGCS